MGAFNYLWNLFSVTSSGSKRKTMESVEIKVKMDCDGCERRVKNSVKNMTGVKSIEINRKLSQLKVSGYVDPNKVLNRVKKTGKRAEFWCYIPHNRVQDPSQVYDKRAPAGYVKNVQTFPLTNESHEETLTNLFSDDNPKACSIM